MAENTEVKTETNAPAVVENAPVAFTAEVVNKTLEAKPASPIIQTVYSTPVYSTPVYCDDPLVNAEVIRIKEERARALREEAERQANAMARALLLEEERKQAERQRQVREQAEIVINSERFETMTDAEKNELYMDYYILNGTQNINRFLKKYPFMYNLLVKYDIHQRAFEYKEKCEEEKRILIKIQEEQRQRELQMERERIAMEVRRAEEERIRKERREKFERELLITILYQIHIFL